MVSPAATSRRGRRTTRPRHCACGHGRAPRFGPATTAAGCGRGPEPATFRLRGKPSRAVSDPLQSDDVSCALPVKHGSADSFKASPRRGCKAKACQRRRRVEAPQPVARAVERRFRRMASGNVSAGVIRTTSATSPPPMHRGALERRTSGRPSRRFSSERQCRLPTVTPRPWAKPDLLAGDPGGYRQHDPHPRRQGLPRPATPARPIDLLASPVRHGDKRRCSRHGTNLFASGCDFPRKEIRSLPFPTGHSA